MKASSFLFPVKVPYSTAPDVVKLREPFQLCPISEEQLHYKKNQIEKFSSDLIGEIESNNLIACLKIITEQNNLSAIKTIDDLGLSVNEDVAILSLGKVIAISFCSPSGFVPTQLLGKSFFEIHQPVPDADLLLRMSDKLGGLLSDINKGPHRRYVWTITANPSLNQHPSLKDSILPTSINDLYFRTEVQTTIPLGDNVHALFAVKVTMTPLIDLWSDTEMKNTILASIDSMSQEMLDYKNLRLIKLILNQSL